MAIIGNIDGVPVFDKKEEAIVWGKRSGLTGYHTHDMNGATGYMGGKSHAIAILKVRAYKNVTTPTTTTTTTGGGGSGGGGY